MDKKELLLTYQSRTGRAVWIGPDTEETLCELAQRGTKNVTVLTPGFAPDCVETLEETRMLAADKFLRSGGEHFSHVPSLNDSELAVDLLSDIICTELQGWAA